MSVMECCVKNCQNTMSLHQYETTKSLYGKPYCMEHEKVANDEAARATEKFTPEYLPLEMVGPLENEGWVVKGWEAAKLINGDQISIMFKSLPLVIKCGGAKLEKTDDAAITEELNKVYALVGTATRKKEPVKEKKKEIPAKEEKKMETDYAEVKKERSPPTESSLVVRNDATLTTDIILKYICPDATEAEAYQFLQLCKYRDLNPFLKEAYLVKYKNAPATMIVGKDAFTRKAEESGKLDGFEAGIIVQPDGVGIPPCDRVGTVLNEGEKLLGGWSKVYRKDMTKPFEIRVGLNEYIKMVDGRPQRNWATMPATMIRKVALVQALREAFTKELGGCYDAVEVAPEEVR